MRKLFTQRARLVVYLEQSELDAAIAKAKQYGQTLQEWARGELRDAAGGQTVEVEIAGPIMVEKPLAHMRVDGLSVPKRALRDSGVAGTGAAASAGKPEVAAKPSGKTCKHGTERGYHCWQCGGLAVIALLLLFLALPCSAQSLPDAPVPSSDAVTEGGRIVPVQARIPDKRAPIHRLHFDSSWWAQAHWTTTAFDQATTGNANSECLARWGVNSTCREETDAWLVGRRPQAWRLGLGWAAESVAVSIIPNKKVRRIVQAGLIGSHVFFGARNLYRWH